jgi:hypothetical protein
MKKEELKQKHLQLCRENLPKLKKDLNHNDRLIVRTRNILDDLLKEKKNLLVKIDACQSTLSKEDKKWL